MASVALRGIRKTYPNGQVAVRGVDLEVRDGELLVLVGPSGCGKSTLLRLIAGLETPTAGRVFVGGDDVTGREPRERDVAMVFQSYALYPHKTVRDNLAFGLRMRKVAAAEIERRIAEAARVLGLEELLDRRPAQLSGGQRQRVALGRAIVREPRAFLLDEPLSNLDARLRAEMRAELIRLRRRLGTTTVYVTHDQEEAMTLGDRIAVLRDGRIEQIDEPLGVYERPATVFVAGFVGSPAMNFVPVSLAEEAGAWWLRGTGLRLAMPGRFQPGAGPARLLVGIRPQELRVVAPGDGDASAQVDVVETLGSADLIHVLLGGDDPVTLRSVVPHAKRLSAGDRVGLRFPAEFLHLFEAETGRRLPRA